MANSQERDAEKDENKTNRPRDQSFYQQRLPAWQPLLTARTVYPLFLVISICFIPLGAYMYTVSQGIFEKVLPYTHCKQGNTPCSEVITQAITPTQQYRVCNCSLNFTLDSDVEGSVYMYYSLTNFFQNHRRYVKSRDDQQLHGSPVTSPVADCNPYSTGQNGTATLPYAPCGAIANSLFNDSFTLHFLQSNSSFTDVGLLKSGIAWPTDVHTKFGDPPTSYFKESLKPPNWKLSPTERVNKPFTEDEDFIVWMRTAALPKFRKLYRRINHTAAFKNGLPKGTYAIKIAYAYPVTSFGGTKSIILSSTSWIGGKNDILGISYMAVGCIHFVLAIVFIVIDIKTKKRNTSFDVTDPTNACSENTQHTSETSSLNVEHDQRV